MARKPMPAVANEIPQTERELHAEQIRENRRLSVPDIPWPIDPRRSRRLESDREAWLDYYLPGDPGIGKAVLHALLMRDSRVSAEVQEAIDRLQADYPELLVLRAALKYSRTAGPITQVRFS